MAEQITYKEAGVDIHAAAELVGDIGELRARTEKNRKLYGAFGLFAAGFDLSSYNEPVIFTGCDGVGTKLELLLEHDLLETAGKDLVAMSVNDILTTGADPVMFLDYVGVGKLDKTKISRVITGIVEWCESCDCILAGGETAEMPDLVSENMIELSGFGIGVAEKPDVVDPTTIGEGDTLIGYPSDGIHANGWSLVRRILSSFPQEFTDEDVISLLAPTRLYHDVVKGLRDAGVKAKAMAHITGGGLPENLERILGDKGASLEVPVWELPAVGKVLNHVETDEAFSTFNMGIGWVSIVNSEDEDVAMNVIPGAVRLGSIGGDKLSVKLV
ncbi:MAG: phosphoribosylformylglycinamidine cyclo-ligase [Akkermansiaceae bacterium]|jgi:phosphoribosylformylglycinamidine cyclo-ligase|nr:phosphoribosylformylglycinamidine cyclo-ligase [Akkermansiaceae bacterium]MDG1853406.1 phosphoribosylformylglycinamidine cyclo-ligase [Verrucomicrobiales bacterium]